MCRYIVAMFRHSVAVSGPALSPLAPVSCDQPERKSGCASRFTTAFCSRELSDGVFSIALSYFVNRAYPSSSRTHTTLPPSLNW